MATVKKFNEEIVCLSKMEDGDVAEIIAWTDRREIGKVIQRYGNNIIIIGEPYGSSYPTILGYDNVDEECLVKILSKGTTIEL